MVNNMKRKRKENFYVDVSDGIFVTNIVNGKNNMIVVLTVSKSADYTPIDADRFLRIKYMPDVRLIAREYKYGFNYYVYDVNFTLEDELDVTDEVVDYLNNNIFDLKVK